ncbi:ankyrin repeat and LEM domain-containing protein 2 homolog [Culicoides brevitarsis]|uniref:ankyrin repeat and LEM domain-containing protein 2 homolog n=1 Tax=Culicoides brevitarsis TaxID=469753 RepID=UPI00307B6A05
MEYFAIHIPKKTEEDSETAVNVFTTREDALKLLKTHKEARFKAFQSKDEAEEFSLYGTLASTINVTGLKSPSSLPIAAEKSLHRSLKPQELVAFRKEIEQNNLSNVYRMVMENPRYLVTAANTPTILKEGTRYNPLHVAIISKHLNMCKLILQTIEKPQFIEMCNGPSLDTQSTQEASMILLESYLNMPDKPRSETPLHFAAKLGLKDIIELLISYPICKMKPNSDGMLPKDIICSRVSGTPELIKEISDLLQERFYVPIWRATDNTVPPVIGEPFSTTDPPKLEREKHGPQMEIKAYAGPMDKEQAQVFKKRLKTPPRLIASASAQSPYKRSPIPPASPLLSPTKFKNNLLNNNYASTPVGSPQRGRKLFTERLNLEEDETDDDDEEAKEDAKNGNHETNGGDTNEIRTPQKLSNAVDRFFRDYRDDRHNESSLLDMSLPNSNNSYSFICEETSSVYDPASVFTSPPVKERLVRITDPDKGVETVGRELAKTQNVGWKEYWKFLDKFVDLSSKEGLEMFEEYLKNRENLENVSSMANNLKPSSADDSIFSLCAGLNTLNLNKEELAGTPKGIKSLNETIKLLQERRNAPSHQQLDAIANNNHITNPYLSIEKALQVYAKRTSLTLAHNIDAQPGIALDQEIRKLDKLVLSFINDKRFVAVNLRKSHSRYGHLINWYLRNDVPFLSPGKTQKMISNLEKSTKLKCMRAAFATGTNTNPHSLSTEQECIEAWNAELECDCSMVDSAEANDAKVKEMRRNRRKLRLGLWQNEPAPQIVSETDLWKPRTAKSSDDEQDSGASVEEDDVYFSCDSDLDLEFHGSDEEMDHDSCFVTPPESPTDFESVYENSDDWMDDDFDDSYENYIEGTLPTKSDIDAFRAISTVNVAENDFPHVYKWKMALQRLNQSQFSSESSSQNALLLGKAKNAFKLF